MSHVFRPGDKVIYLSDVAKQIYQGVINWAEEEGLERGRVYVVTEEDRDSVRVNAPTSRQNNLWIKKACFQLVDQSDERKLYQNREARQAFARELLVQLFSSEDAFVQYHILYESIKAQSTKRA